MSAFEDGQEAKRMRVESNDGPGHCKCGTCGEQGHYAKTCGKK